MFYLYLLCFAGILYYYRKFLIVKIFKLFVVLMKWRIQNFNIVKQDAFKLGECDIIGKFNIKEYNIVHNNKDHIVIFANDSCISHDFSSEINDFKSNINEYLLNKNMIVHCSITNEHDDIVLDTTVEFRKFCYYYEKKFVLLPFFNRIQNYIRNKGNNDVNIFDYNFTIYLNDSEFTEYKYCIRDILHSNFDMLFESKKFV
jgi:hypothetical protein